MLGQSLVTLVNSISALMGLNDGVKTKTEQNKLNS